MNLKPAPVTPLRRSERLRRPTAKAIGSSPSSSPGTTAYVSRSINTRPRVFYAPGGQTDSDSTLRNTSSSQSSGSCTEDTVGDAADCMAMAASFPPKIYETYQGLAPLLRYYDADFMKRVSLLSFSQRRTRPHLFPPSPTPTTRHTGHSLFNRLSQRVKRVPAENHWNRAILHMARVQQFHATLQSDRGSHQSQVSNSATGDGGWPPIRRGTNTCRDESRALAGGLGRTGRHRVHTGFV